MGQQCSFVYAQLLHLCRRLVCGNWSDCVKSNQQPAVGRCSTIYFVCVRSGTRDCVQFQERSVVSFPAAVAASASSASSALRSPGSRTYIHTRQPAQRVYVSYGSAEVEQANEHDARHHCLWLCTRSYARLCAQHACRVLCPSRCRAAAARPSSGGRHTSWTAQA